MNASVRIHETPTQQLLAKASAEYKVRDIVGRTFTLKKPPFLAQFKLVELAGSSASNDTFMSMILPLIYVVAIDDDPIALPVNRLQLDGLIARVDEHGFTAISKGLLEHFTRDEDPAEAKAALKK